MKALTLSLLLAASGAALAHSNEDQVKVCYLFNSDKLISTKPCVVSSGGGAGGLYSNIKMGKKSYSIESGYNGEDATMNNKPAVTYSRNEFYNRLADNQDVEPFMFCTQQKGSNISVCHN